MGTGPGEHGPPTPPPPTHPCAGDFFEGWHKAGRPARGVYEGSYWELIGDCDQMIEMLRAMSKAPSLMDEPTLELPPQELPK